MGTDDICTGSGAPKDPTHKSLPDAIDAHAGKTGLLLDGAQPSVYVAGHTYRLTVTPEQSDDGDGAANSANAKWYLLDAGVGRLAPVADGGGAAAWRTQCNATRASFASAGGGAVSVLWAIPAAAHGALVLRVAVATAMGRLSVNAAILNASTAVAPLPASAMGYACTVSQAAPGAYPPRPWALRQCQSVPPGTVGARNKSSCDAECLRGAGTFRCNRCAHVYDAERDGNGVPFEDLPETWKCPTCGAPKSAYAKQVGAAGEVRWAHVDGDRRDDAVRDA